MDALRVDGEQSAPRYGLQPPVSAIVALFHALPAVRKADDGEILFFIERPARHGRGIGLIDIHLLASCLVERCAIWTADRRLKIVAEDMHIGGSQS